MKKKLLIITLMLMMVMPFNVFGAEAVVSTSTTIENGTVTPDFVTTLYREVTRTYASESLIPQSIYYQEYVSGSWFKGTLYLRSYSYNTLGYFTAFYTGYIQGQL